MVVLIHKKAGSRSVDELKMSDGNRKQMKEKLHGLLGQCVLLFPVHV